MNEMNIARINELARKQKSPAGLTEQEKAEQAELRREYIAAIRRNLRSQLENVELLNRDGTVTSVKEEHDKKYGRSGENS